MNQKALIYCRVSSQQQRVEGHGLDSQEHRCREYARQKDYEVEAVFQDSFTGAGDFWRRPAMSDLLKYMDSKSYVKYIYPIEYWITRIMPSLFAFRIILIAQAK